MTIPAMAALERPQESVLYAMQQVNPATAIMDTPGKVILPVYKRTTWVGALLCRLTQPYIPLT